MKVIKRNNEMVDFQESKILEAIDKAYKAIDSTLPEDFNMQVIVNEIEDNLVDDAIGIEDIQQIVLSFLFKYNRKVYAAYKAYKEKREFIRNNKNNYEEILSLLEGNNETLNKENSNKSTRIISTQRDYMAGIVSKDLSLNHLLPKRIVDAHNNGVLHFHDLDYFAQGTFNCCLINIKDILDNGTVMNGKEIRTPNSFRTACTIMTQVIATVASNQYGGQSVDIKHLAPYLAKSRLKIRQRLGKYITDAELLGDVVEAELEKELADGIQTIQYQINTLMTTNGQSPFVTLFLHMDEMYEDGKYNHEIALIIQEILKQRYEGIGNRYGVNITPAFPKLIYVLDENNVHEKSRYYSLTELAVKCSARRMYPDYISAKVMKENYEGNVFSPMGCRSFLAPWKDEEGNYKFEGRFNQGVVSLNLPQIAIEIVKEGNYTNSDDKMSLYLAKLDERMELCKDALMERHKSLLGRLAQVSPIHWQFGAIARLDDNDTIDKLLMGGYSSIAFGYIGIYEMTKMLLGVSHTTEEGKKFALKVMEFMKDRVMKWRADTGLGFSLYGTPAESLCYRFAKIDKERFGEIEDITDKGYYTNSYHVDVREEIDGFEKLKFESQFQSLTGGGAISYIEIPNMQNNPEALLELVSYIYDNIQYAEFNTKSDFCSTCSYDGEMTTDGEHWVCPQCGENDETKLTVVRRTCGYLGENYWNKGKTKEIKDRVMHF